MIGEPAIDLDQPRTTKCSPKGTIAVAVVEIPAVGKKVAMLYAQP